ncbi:hypothetical protein ABPG72_000730 [Tetrahymena utriculariae]
MAYELLNLNIIIMFTNSQTFIFDLKGASVYFFISNLSINNLIDIFEQDGKIRFILREIDYFQDHYQLTILCSNLVKNNIIGQYNFQYDNQYFSEFTNQVIEHMIFDNNKHLTLVTQIGYEIIDISGGDQKISNRSNLYFSFKKANNQKYRHLKLLTSNQILACLMDTEKIQILLSKYNSTYIWQDLAQQAIILNRNDYLNFAIGIQQVLKINQQVVIGYNNQIQKKILSNREQSIVYSSRNLKIRGRV